MALSPRVKWSWFTMIITYRQEQVYSVIRAVMFRTVYSATLCAGPCRKHDLLCHFQSGCVCSYCAEIDTMLHKKNKPIVNLLNISFYKVKRHFLIILNIILSRTLVADICHPLIIYHATRPWMSLFHFTTCRILFPPSEAIRHSCVYCQLVHVFMLNWDANIHMITINIASLLYVIVLLKSFCHST